MAPSGIPTEAGSHRAALATLWLVALALLAVTWWTVASTLETSRTRELANAGRDLANLTRVAQEHADRTLRSADQVIRFVRSRYLEVGNALDLKALTQQGVIDAQNFNQVGIIDEHGIYVLANLPTTGRLDLSDREHFRVHVGADSDELFVSKPLVGRASNRWSVQLTRRITRADGRFAGVVVISIDPGYFTRFYSDLNLGHDGMAALYGLDGIARARRVGSKEEFGVDARSAEMFRRIEQGETTGTFVATSPVDGVERLLQYRRLAGYPLAVVTGQSMTDVLASHVESRDALVLQASIASALILALAAALTRYLVRIRHELLARSAAQLEVQERTEQLNAIFDLSPDGFVSFDLDRRVRYVSPAFLQMTGAKAQAIEGMAEDDFCAWMASRCERSSTSPCALAELAATRPGRRSTVTLAQDGKRVLQVGMRAGETGGVAKVLYFRDVTHETEVDQIKSEFLSTAAHELRTPMASIFGFAEMLLMHEVDAAQHEEFLRIIYDQAGAMAKILDELLDLARMEARRGKDFKLAPLDLRALLEDIVRGFKYPAGRAPAAIEMAPGPLPLVADTGKLRQAILNVLSNACKFSADDTAIRILVDNVDDGGSPMVRLRLVDRGIGMTPEQSARVWERFYRAEKSGSVPGTGLGMSIVKEIIELHGGRVAVSSELGQGTTVTLCLPANAAPGDAPASLATPATGNQPLLQT